MQEIKVNIEDINLRLDIFLANNFKKYSRAHIKTLIDEGKVLVNGMQVKAGYKLKLNDIISISFTDATPLNAQPQNIKLDIIYEDSDLLIINKPQGMVVHPAVRNYENTLVNALLYHIKELSKINGELRPGIIHRLDKDTSGILLVAKNDLAHVELSRQIAEHNCKRYYKALCEQPLKIQEGEVITQIGRHPKNRLKMAVLEQGGKLAHTKYKLIKNYTNYSFLECELITGRTHQIRVHLAHINHAVVGDKLYNTKPCKLKLEGQLLHAYKLEFKHPATLTQMVFECDLPEYFEKVLKIIN